jgi:methylmalonyl-CoA mutase
MTEKSDKLFSIFESVSAEEWKEKIIFDLKGKDYPASLIWNTYEGFNVQPFYRRDDLEGLVYPDSMPGEFPFVRGNKKRKNDWFIRQDIRVKEAWEANKKAIDILNKGINSLGFYLDCNLSNVESEFEILLKDIPLDAIETNFKCSCYNCNYSLPFSGYLFKNYYPSENITGSFDIDPLASFILTGVLKKDSFTGLKVAVDAMNSFLRFRVIGVHGELFANSGASLVQELAFSLAQGVEYLIKLSEAGVNIDNAAKNIKFNFGVGGNYFMEIAKLRAARFLWAKIVKEFNPEYEDSCRMVIHSRTNFFNKTFYDPYVNMIRTQTEAMSAGLGSADSITVEPFNSVFGETNEFSERIARNQQIILKEESHFDKIIDPAAGSYYIENLTASIAEHAWELFLRIYDMGGFVKAFKYGFIQKEIKAVAVKRDLNVFEGRTNILGTNIFPDFLEQKKSEVDNSYFYPLDLTTENAEVETLKPYRSAQPFEALRYKTDMYSLKNERPVVFMLPIGNLSLRRARARFSCNFFAVAGFEIIDNNGFATAGEGVSAAKENEADIIVVCSSDDENAEIVPLVHRLLNDEILVVAGNPPCRPELEEKGILNFIHVKSNILEELKKYQNLVLRRD